MRYVSHFQEGEYKDLVSANRQKDVVLRRSVIGVHKDEIHFVLDGEILKRFGSQGQIKSYLIALKLAEYAFYQKEMNLKPFLLLDDIFEKIDDSRYSVNFTNGKL